MVCEMKAVGLPSKALSKLISTLDFAAGEVCETPFLSRVKVGNEQQVLSKDLPRAYHCPGCHRDSEP